MRQFNLSRINRSFSAKLSFFILLLTAVLFIAASAIVTHYSRKLIREEAIKNAFSILKGANQEIENVLLSVSVAVDNLAVEVREEALYGGEKGMDNMYELTRKVVSQNEHIVGSCIAFEPYFYPTEKYFSPYSFQVSADSISTNQVGNIDYEYQYMDWFLIPKLTNKSYWTDPFYDEGAGNIIMCTYTHPLFDENGNFFGVLTADIPTDWLTEIVENIKPYEGSYNLMIGKAAAYIVHTDPSKILNETIFSANAEEEDTTITFVGREMVQGKTGYATIHKNNVSSFVFYAPISKSGWSLEIICPHRDVYAGVDKMSIILVCVIIIGLFLLTFLCAKTIKALTKPLSVFASSARIIAEGNFNTPLPEITSEDEMRELHDSLQYMQTSLSTYIEELKTTTSAKERIESELNIAREIQMGMIPKIFPPFPERSDIDIFAMLRPAKEVGGDLYDFFINDEKLYFAIGDVSGKGVPASLFMAVTRSLFRSVATTLEDPARIVTSMNGAISETNDANMFVTLFVGVLDLKSGLLQYCNAGHNPPVLIISDDNEGSEVFFMDVIPNIPVGLFEGFEFKAQTMHLPQNSVIFMYTDGLTEAENEQKELFTERRLLSRLENCKGIDAESMVKKVLFTVEEHVAGAMQSDDLTMFVIDYAAMNIDKDGRSKRRMVIRNQVDELNILARFIEKVGEEFELPMALTMSLNLALEEAVSNVIFYAYPKGEQHHTIEIDLVKDGNILEFTITDYGVPFDPTAAAEADITLPAEERKIGGLGIYLVRKIMDKVEYKRDNQRNILIMSIDLSKKQ